MAHVKKDSTTDGEFQFKVIIIGMLSVGKTSVLLRYVHNTFEDRISRFISEERKAIRIQNQEILLNLWDTAGKRLRHVSGVWYATRTISYSLP